MEAVFGAHVRGVHLVLGRERLSNRRSSALLTSRRRRGRDWVFLRRRRGRVLHGGGFGCFLMRGEGGCGGGTLAGARALDQVVGDEAKGTDEAVEEEEEPANTESPRVSWRV